MAIAPWIQLSPRWASFLAVPPFQAVVQAVMPDFTLAALLKTLNCTAAAGKLTEVSPISFCRGAVDEELTVDSAKANVLDVPSVTALSALDCWKAKSPVVVTDARLATLEECP